MITGKKNNIKYTMYLAFLAIGLSFLAQTTPLWVSKTSGTPLLICSGFATRTIIIDENGKEIPAPPTIKNRCVMCFIATVHYYIPNDMQEHGLYPTSAMEEIFWRKASITHTTKLATPNHAIRAPPKTT